MLMLEIDELIRKELNEKIPNGCRLEILYRLKQLNKEAFLWMRRFGKRWKTKYREMWRQSFWREGRRLLKEYFAIESKDGILTCSCCNRVISDGKFVLHHSEFYNQLNLFTPIYVELLCSEKCHSKRHGKKGEENEGS